MSQAHYITTVESRKSEAKRLNPCLNELPLLSVAEYERIVYERPLMADWMAEMLSLVMGQQKGNDPH